MFTPGVNALDLAFDEILSDLRTQYLIGFYPKGVPLTQAKNFTGSKFARRSPELRVVSRTGYYGETMAANR